MNGDITVGSSLCRKHLDLRPVNSALHEHAMALLLRVTAPFPIVRVSCMSVGPTQRTYSTPLDVRWRFAGEHQPLHANHSRTSLRRCTLATIDAAKPRQHED